AAPVKVASIRGSGCAGCVHLGDTEAAIALTGSAHLMGRSISSTPEASVAPIHDRAPRPDSWVSVEHGASERPPTLHSILWIGACLVHAPDREFYVELKPTTDTFVASAMKVSGLDHAQLKESGVDPREAMEQFAQWLDAAVPAGHVPVFAGFNAPFDW